MAIINNPVILLLFHLLLSLVQGKPKNVPYIDGCRCGDTYDNFLVYSADRILTDVDEIPLSLFPSGLDVFPDFLGWDLDSHELSSFTDTCLDYFKSAGLDFSSITPDSDGSRILTNSDGAPIAQFFPGAMDTITIRYRLINGCINDGIDNCPIVRDVSYQVIPLNENGLKVTLNGNVYTLNLGDTIACGTYKIIQENGEVIDILFTSGEPIRAPNSEGVTPFRCFLDWDGIEGKAQGIFVSQYDPDTRTASIVIRNVLTFPAQSGKAECTEPCDCGSNTNDKFIDHQSDDNSDDDNSDDDSIDSA